MSIYIKYNIIGSELVIFRNICIYSYMHTITSIKKGSHDSEVKRSRVYERIGLKKEKRNVVIAL